MQNEDQLHQLFLEHGVSAVIFGHMHHYNYHVRDGIPYVMTVSATRMVRPLKGLRVVLPAGTKDHPLTFTLHRRLPHPPEAYPSCIARALYLTSDGDVVQSEHTFTIVAAHAAR